jgi:predicted DNA binding CopG/RHH family protein
MEEPMSTDKVPQTDSIHELAQFWDTHDLTDFEEQLEEVAEPVFEREKVVQVHLPARDAETVESIARAKGLNPGDLIRGWIMEKVQPSSQR